MRPVACGRAEQYIHRRMIPRTAGLADVVQSPVGPNRQVLLRRGQIDVAAARLAARDGHFDRQRRLVRQPFGQARHVAFVDVLGNHDRRRKIARQLVQDFGQHPRSSGRSS